MIAVNTVPRSPRRVGLRSCLVATLAVALVACGVGGIPFQATDIVKRTLEIAPGTPLVIETFNGSVRVTAARSSFLSATVERRGEGRTRAAAEADLAGIDVSLELVDGTAVLRAVYSPSPHNVTGARGASMTVEVPIGTHLTASTSNGGISVGSLEGPVTARTSNGPVDIGNATGVVDVETSNGHVTVSATDALVQARTSNGAIRLSGSLGHGAHQLGTSNGPIDVRLPAESTFGIDAETSNGRITSDFAVIGEVGQTRLRGTVGRAATATLVIRTSNATIALEAVD